MPDGSTYAAPCRTLEISGDVAADARAAAPLFVEDGGYFSRGEDVVLRVPSTDGSSWAYRRMSKEDLILVVQDKCTLLDRRPKRDRRRRADGPVNFTLPTAALLRTHLKNTLPPAPVLALPSGGIHQQPAKPPREERQRAAQIRLCQDLWDRFGSRPFTAEEYRKEIADPADRNSPSRQRVAGWLAKLIGSDIPGFDVTYERNGRWPAGMYSVWCYAEAPPPKPPARKRAVLLVPATAAQRGQRLRREREAALRAGTTTSRVKKETR